MIQSHGAINGVHLDCWWFRPSQLPYSQVCLVVSHFFFSHLSHTNNPLETFLYGFLTPILSYMLEERLHLDSSQTQTYTTALLTTHGFIGLVSAPIVAHLAEKTSSQKKPLLIALAGCFVGTLMIALAPSGMSTSILDHDSWKLIIMNSLGTLRWSHPAIYGGCRYLGGWVCSFGKQCGQEKPRTVDGDGHVICNCRNGWRTNSEWRNASAIWLLGRLVTSLGRTCLGYRCPSGHD